jgi:aminopeptidase C
MSLTGYLHFRSIDVLRYPIYKIDNDYLYMYKDKKYKLNIPNNFKNKFIDVTLSNKINYVDYEKERKEKGFPKVYEINDIKVINNGDIELPIIF